MAKIIKELSKVKYYHCVYGIIPGLVEEKADKSCRVHTTITLTHGHSCTNEEMFSLELIVHEDALELITDKEQKDLYEKLKSTLKAKLTNGPKTVSAEPEVNIETKGIITIDTNKYIRFKNSELAYEENERQLVRIAEPVLEVGLNTINVRYWVTTVYRDLSIGQNEVWITEDCNLLKLPHSSEELMESENMIARDFNYNLK